MLPIIKTPCQRCGTTLPHSALLATCGQCQQFPPVYNRVIAACEYIQPINQFIRQFKFANKLEYRDIFVQLLCTAIENHHNGPLPEQIIPVPLHPQRLRERGYNQSRELAYGLATRLYIQLDDSSCRRIKNTPQQTGLKAKQRRSNLRQAFQVQAKHLAQHIAIVDDVMTTGSTANALATILKKQGVKTVDIWVIARTPILSTRPAFL